VVNPFTDPDDLVLSVATDSDPLELHFTSGNVGALAFDRLCLTDDSGALADGQFSITVSLANGATSERTWTTTADDPTTYGGLMSFSSPLTSATLTTLDANRFVSVDDVRVGEIPEPRACALAAALGVAAYALFRRRFRNRPHPGDTRCQPCRLGGATILGLALAAWQTVHASTPTTLIDTRPYWPLIPGMVWTYRNARNPQHVTRVEVRQVSERGVGLWFTKNHADTYWARGTSQNLMFFLTRAGGYLYASNPRDLQEQWCSAYNDWPDDQRFDRDTGRLLSNYWYLRCIPDGIPPYLVFPDSLTVPSTIEYDQYYASEDYFY
jgi:hypothetical protein